jgi:hypothetical protein
MKKNLHCIWTGLLLAAILSGCSASKGVSKEEKAAQEAVLRTAIENRTFVVEVDRALPMTGNVRALTSLYSLEINGDTVKSHLPFFGRAYSVPYGGGEGLIFESSITDYQSSFDKKGKAAIEFKTKSKEDRLDYRIYIYTNGTASIDVTSVNRQHISFTGNAYPASR